MAIYGIFLLFFVGIIHFPHAWTSSQDLRTYSTPLQTRWPSRSVSTRKNSAGMVDDAHALAYTQQLLNVTTVAEQTVLLHCASMPNSKETEKLEWRRDNHLLPVNHRQLVYPNGTLAIEKVDARLDAGVYVCQRGGRIQQEYHLRVIIPPRIDPLQFPLDLSPGARLRVSCLVSRGDPPISIQWYKDGMLLSASKEIVVQDIDEYASFLLIPSLSVQHAGNYTCLASNDVAQDTRTAVLTVNVPVYWVNEPTDTVALHRTDLRLTCQANGNPQPVIEWKKSVGNTPGNYTPVASVRQHVFDNGTLWIQDLERTDEGSYLCQATNGIGPAISKVIHLAVKAPAYFLLDRETTNVPLRSTASLTCSALGDLPMTITWHYKNVELKDNHFARLSFHSQATPDGQESTILIKHAERSDSGEYVCKVTNEYGSAKKVINLLVQEVPEAPTSISVLGTNSRMVKIGWTGGYDGNSPVINFIVEWKRPHEGWNDDGVKREYTPGNSSEYTVKSLKPAQRYDMRIRASNILGQSEPSQLVQILCDEEAPSDIPMDVQAVAASSTAVNLTWIPPVSDGWNGQLIGYNVGYKVENTSGDFANITIKSDGKRKESVVLKGLRKYTTYVIIVQARNAMGLGPPAIVTGIRTFEDVPSEAPYEITASATSSTRISITWEPLPSEYINGVLLGYKVLFKPSTEWTSQPDVKMVTETSCSVDDLKKFTNYTIHVLAFTKMGDGVSSAAVYAETFSDVPSAPAEIKAILKSPNSILVTWMDPVEKNGIIIRYNVYMRPLSGNGDNEVKRTVYPLDAPNQYEFTDLTGSSKYEFFVTAETDRGEGPPTIKVQTSVGSAGPARIASFGTVVSQPMGTSAILPCYAVGFPQPTTEWFKGNKLISTGILSNGSLSIKDLQPQDAGAYTCKVRNSYNTEFLDHSIIVQHAPEAPLVTIASSTSNSLTVEWKVTNDGGSMIKAFTLYYRPETGSWKSVRLPANYNSYSLPHLGCGQMYHVYMTAFNDIGTSDPSLETSAHTSGQAPLSPDLKAFLVPNTTSVLLLLSAWKDGGCPIRTFSIKYQTYYESLEWKTVGGLIPGGADSFFMKDLLPETVYRMRTTVHNDAGATEKEYIFSTLTENGEATFPEVVLQKDSVLAFHENTTNVIWLSIVATLLGIFVVVVGVMTVCRRRRQRKFRSTDLDDATNIRRDLTSENVRFDLERTPRKSTGIPSPWRNIAHYMDANNHSPVSLASTPKQWQPPIYNNVTVNEASNLFSSPKRQNTAGRQREALILSETASHYQTPSNRSLKRDESTPDSGFSGSNVKHNTDCDSFQRDSIPRLSDRSNNSDSDAGVTHKLNCHAHKTRPKPAQRRRLPTRPRQGASSLPRTKAPPTSSSSPSSTEDVPAYVYPYCTNRVQRGHPQATSTAPPHLHFPSPPHSDGDEKLDTRAGSRSARPKTTPLRKEAFKMHSIQRRSANVDTLGELMDELVDNIMPLHPNTAV
ncbi:cell adhesion molecule Dscam2-like [Paramacrobiotus metropolitanus]|uniref:cell adhesion molecule Dscam2-like n=1 Tax=Paramacrobiotus metropolitanus TaxID=2943436 RepID=UPI00244646D3|nr:cell adhesion molecule Dscam2-like [Paramacrobiotus metropolitanus]